jgi:hypothetical protein
MGNYNPIFTQIGTQTKKKMLNSKFIIPEVEDKIQDGRRRLFGNSNACYKMGNYNTIFMQIGTMTNKKHAEFENYNTRSVDQVSRWPPPPCWKFK